MPQGAGRDGSSIRHYLAVLRRRWPVVAVLSVLACATAVLVTLVRAPVYEAKSTILLQPEAAEELLAGATGTGFSNRSGSAAADEVGTEIEVMRSQVVTDAVRAKLGREPDVSVEARGTTDVIDIRARSTSRAAAAAEATTFAEVYVELRRSQRVGDLLRTGELIRAQVRDLNQRLADIEKPLREIEARLESTNNAQTRSQLQQQREATINAINVERKTLETRQDAYDDQLNRLELLSGLGTSGVQVVSRAEVPQEPASPGPFRNGLLGLAGGLAVGLGLAFLLDQVDDRLRRKEELESVTHLPVLGLLPFVAGRQGMEGVVSLVSPASPTAEAYRTLRTSLQFMAIDRPIRCLQITSPTSAEGKTTVVTNLAAAFAQAGQRVILVDCDLRRSRVHEYLGVSNARGFTSVLLDQCALGDVVTTIEDEPFLAILPAGPAPPNPSELLSSERAAAMFATLRENCDVLLLDSPPVLPVTDALVIARHVDATLLVARPKRSTRRQVARAYELLDQVGAPLVGTVMNGMAHGVDDGYGYGYGSGTYRAPERRPARGRRNESPSANGAAPERREPARSDVS